MREYEKPKDPSILSDIKTVTLEFIRFQRKPSLTSQAVGLGLGILGAYAAGPISAVVGMGLGLIAGEVTHVRIERLEA